MRTGIVDSLDLKNRKAVVILNGGASKDVFIPINLDQVNIGCEVLVDTDTSSIIAILDYPKYDQEFLTSPVQIPGRVNFKPTSGNYGGDYIRSLPQTGFLALLRGYVSLFGGSTLSQIISFGKQKLLRFIADNYEIIGKNIKISIYENKIGLPSFLFEIGNFTIKSNCDDEIIFELKGVAKIIFSKKEHKIELYDPTTNDIKEIYKFSKTISGINTQEFKFDEIRAKLLSLILHLKDKIEIVSDSLVKISGGEINISSIGNTTIKGKNTLIDSGDITTLKASSALKIMVGESSPGTVDIINGTLSKISMDPAGVTKIKSPQIQINGFEDQLVSNIQLSTLLIGMMNSLEPTSTAIKTISIQLKTLSSILKASPVAPASAIIDNVIINLDMMSSGIDAMRSLCLSSVMPPGNNMIGNKFISTGLMYTPGP